MGDPKFVQVPYAEYIRMATALELLEDLNFCHGEQEAIGGGPGWQERDRKAWAAVAEFFEP